MFSIPNSLNIRRALVSPARFPLLFLRPLTNLRSDYCHSKLCSFHKNSIVSITTNQKCTFLKNGIVSITNQKCILPKVNSKTYFSSWTSASSGFQTQTPPRSSTLIVTCKMSNGNIQSPPSPITEALEKVKASGLLKSQALINGLWVDADEGKTLEVNNPATNEVFAHVPKMGYKETTQAIDAAAEAFKTWSVTTTKERSKLLRAWFDLIIKNRQELAQLMTLEQGKPLKEALTEVDYGAGYVEFYAEEAKRAYGDIIPAPLPDRRILVIRQPVGVVAIITPWNFPIAMITRKVAPALAAGCTVVIKPAELTPLSAYALGELANQAGIPPGVLNVVTGEAREIGNAMLESDIVKKLSFTGSTPVGKKLMAAASNTVKKVALELGGNAPFIVFDDANMEAAAKGALVTKFRNSGQTCICANRFLVQDGVYDKFLEAFTKQVEGLKIGNGLDEGVTQGPLINEAAIEKSERHIEDALKKGAKLITGGKRHSLGGTFFEPTILGDATPEMMIHREEVFGPVAPIFRFKDEKEALKLANDTEFGLASYIFTENIARGWRVSEALQYGMVGFNEAAISTEFAPFGGIKQSGHEREGSKYGLEGYMEMKYILLGGLKPYE